MNLIVRLVILLCCASVCSASDFASLVKTPLTIQREGVEIQGFRFSREHHEPDLQKPWIIFTHGLTSNYHEFESLIPHFVDAGYDCFAFNFRGHGNGSERSNVSTYRNGDYRFEKMADVDLPAMIETIQKLHPGPGQLIGHSMGGMVPRASFHRGRITPEQISSMVLIGSPAHFKTASREPDYFGFKWHLKNYLFFGAGDQPMIRFDQIRTASALTNFLGPVAWGTRFFVDAAMDARAEKEMGPLAKDRSSANWTKRAMSEGTPKDIFRSFADFQDSYPYDSVPITVPILHIVGDKDTLAPANDIVESARAQSAAAGYRVIRVEGIGHFGLVAPWVIDGYLDTVLAFLKRPSLSGTRNTVVKSFSPHSLDAHRPLQCRDMFR